MGKNMLFCYVLDVECPHVVVSYKDQKPHENNIVTGCSDFDFSCPRIQIRKCSIAKLEATAVLPQPYFEQITAAWPKS
jgi:hypothetical protein